MRAPEVPANGCFTVAELEQRGLTRRTVGRRVEEGWWQRPFRGVVFTGPVVDPRSRLRAALLAVPRAALAGPWALWVNRLGPEPAPATPVGLAVTAGRAARDGVEWHFVDRLDGDVVVFDGLRTLTVARLVLEQAAREPDDRAFEHFVHLAQVKRRLRRTQLQAVLDGHPRHRGARRLAAVLAQDAGTATESVWEERLLRLLRRAELPLPQFQRRLGRTRDDAVWVELGLVLEVNPWSTHGTKQQARHDARRSQDAAARGEVLVVVTDDDLGRRPHAVVAKLAQAIAARTEQRRRAA